MVDAPIVTKSSQISSVPPSSLRKYPFEPAPWPGLKRENFQKICVNGFGDRHNSFAHSMAWFKNHLYIGTTRSNLCMLKLSIQHFCGKLEHLAVWPVDCPETVEEIYQLDRRAQIWRYDPVSSQWQQVLRSPTLPGEDGKIVPRDIGYRGMTVFQGASDPEPVLYVATWSPRFGPGPVILRTADGENFEIVSDYGIIGLPITSIRLLIPFKDRLFTSPTGTKGGKMNVSGVPVVYASRDPVKGKWEAVSLPGFGDLNNEGVFSLQAFGDRLYAGTFNSQGFQIWRTDAQGQPPYHWEKVLEHGGYRGALNQIALSMAVFKGALYVGSGIQNGGYDRINKIGPAASQLLRIWPDDTWELIVGSPLKTPQGLKKPLSGLGDGFGNFFNGYFWRMGVQDDWLYLGTYDASGFLPWLSLDNFPSSSRRLLEQIGMENLLKNRGCELWRSWDGENWLPVDRQGFGNPFNSGIRNLVSSPYGLFVGTINPYGPKIAVHQGGSWEYVENVDGGLEVWLGSI